MKKLIAGNWKMNGNMQAARTLAADIVRGIESDKSLLGRCDFLVCPPFVHITLVQSLLPHVSLGAQNCSRFEDGAHTGNISAAMLKDAGCSYVILGHSERRQNLGETSAVVALKAAQAHKNGLIAIICVGETESERQAGQEQSVVLSQLRESLPQGATAGNTVIAYEPVWAIGTGKTATPGDAAAMHGFIREKLKEQVADSQKMRILYGGSMKPENAAELLKMPHIDGGLIGGASLKADQFLAIAKAA